MQESIVMKGKTASYLLLSVFIFFFIGCGYTLQRSFPSDSVRLGRIENLTAEPGLGDRFEEALTLSLMKNGIKLREDSSFRIEGTIEELKLRSLAEKDGITVTYEVTMTGSFYLAGPQPRKLRSGNVFIVAFSSDESLEKVMALKDEAIDRTLLDIADQIAASIIYGR